MTPIKKIKLKLNTVLVILILEFLTFIGMLIYVVNM